MFKPLVNPMISIIMPTYNRADLIIDTIASIQNQSWTNWELLIIDDGSEDNTEQLVQYLNDDRIQFYKAGRIGIVGQLKNIGLQKSKGKLIAFIDSDDLWHPDKLKKQVEALLHNTEAGFCLVGGYNFRTINQPQEYFYKQRSGNICENVFISIFQSKVSCYTQALMIRKECLSDISRFKEQYVFNDVDFIIELAFHFKAVILYEPLVYRRLHETNFIHDSWETTHEEGIEIIKKNRYRLPIPVVQKALFQSYINFGEKYLKVGQKQKAIMRFFQAWKNQPLSLIPLRKIGKALLRPSK